jgi:hypothetical protein
MMELPRDQKEIPASTGEQDGAWESEVRVDTVGGKNY